MKEIGRRGVMAYFRKRVLEEGGRVYRVQFSGVRGAPDTLAHIPNHPKLLHPFLAELKRPVGGKVSKSQANRHRELRDMGFAVFVPKSKTDVDHLLRHGWC